MYKGRMKWAIWRVRYNFLRFLSFTGIIRHGCQKTRSVCIINCCFCRLYSDVQQDLHCVHQFDILDRDLMSFFVALLLGWVALMHCFHDQLLVPQITMSNLRNPCFWTSRSIYLELSSEHS